MGIHFFLLFFLLVNFVWAETPLYTCDSHGRPDVTIPTPIASPLPFIQLPVTAKNESEPLINFEIGLKILLLSATNSSADEPGGEVIKKTLQSYNIPFDHLILTANGKRIDENLLSLINSDGSGKYYGIITTTGQLTFKNEKAELESGLTKDQWAQLEKYEKDYSIRRVSLYSYPHPALGVANSPGQLSTDSTFIGFNNNAKDFDLVAAGLNKEVRIPSSKIWIYPTKITDSIASPFLYFNDETKKDVGGIIVSFPDKRKQMHFFFSQELNTLPSLLVSSVWINWLTKGVYQGKRRVFFNIQVDDFFLSTRIWEPTKLEIYRVSPAEIENFITWQKGVMQYFTNNRNFKIEMAFNGFGVQDNGTISHDQLYLVLKNRVEEFNWVSHTYAHPILNDMQFNPIDQDLKKNINFAENFLGPLKSYYSPNSIVTPGISGLFNKDAIRSFFNNQIISAVGDNSRPELAPQKPYHARYSTDSFNGLAGLLIIPRHPTQVYFNVSTPRELTAQYNIFYPQYGGKAEFDQIYAAEVKRVSRLMYAYDPTPHMFHQANLRLFDYQGGQFSLLSLWMKKIVDEVRLYLTLPILNLKMNDLAELYSKRMALDECDVQSKLVINQSKIVSVKILSKNHCEVSFTGIEVNSNIGISSEKYGPDQTITLDPQNTPLITLKFPLTFSY